MKHLKRNTIALLLALCLLPAVPAAGAWEPVDGWETELVDGLSVRSKRFWTGKELLTEQYLCLEPDSTLRVRSVGGEAVCQSLDAGEAAARLASAGQRPMAAVNGGFFNLSSLVTVGVSVQDGVLRSSAAEDAWMQAVGFRADGSAVFGKPAETISLELGGVEHPVGSLNRKRGEGLCLFTADCTVRGRSLAEGYGWNLLCRMEGSLPISGSRDLLLVSVTAGEGPVEIPAGHVLISLSGDPEAEPPAYIADLEPGAVLRLRFRCAAGWEDVESAVSLLYPLVEEGKILPQTLKAAEPRSAIGVTEAGALILYTVDGRQSGYSVGLGLDDLAQRMAELGCVEAGALDGGTSTALHAVLPGDEDLSAINRPASGGRKVVNWLFVASERPPTGTAARLALEPLRVRAVAGAEIPLTVKAVDENGWPAPLPEVLRYELSEGLGRVEDGVLHCAGTGSGTLRVSAEGLRSAEIPLTVTETPEEIALYGEAYGRRTDSLSLAYGQEVDLTVRATDGHILLSGDDTCYTWTLESAAGTVDETGHLIPAPVTGSGLLTVSAGERSLSIPISVWSGVPFTDVSALDESFPAVRYAYEHHLFNGVSEQRFAPETVMNRAMLVTVLWRMEGEPAAENVPGFTDVVPGAWYADAVAWATETGLVRGYDAARFGPEDDLTKEQILTILHRAAGCPEAVDQLDDYADGSEAGDWAAAALGWALDRGVLRPAEDRLAPREPMTRAAVAEALMRYLEQ